MIEWLKELDTALFLFLNGLHAPSWDTFMSAVSGKLIWLPLYLFILFLLYRRYGRKTLVLLLFIVLLITMSDQLSVKAFKEVFQRFRPCHEPALAGLVHTVNGKCGGSWGFVSSHASNSFALALFSLLLIRDKPYTAFIVFWAFLVSYSRIYLGVHYPGDILGGAILGGFIGWLVYKAYRFIDNRWIIRSSWLNAGRNEMHL